MTNSSNLSALKFFLPPELEASEPPEARGLRRDQVRLMVSNYSTDKIKHASFYDLSKISNPRRSYRYQYQPYAQLRADGNPCRRHAAGIASIHASGGRSLDGGSPFVE